MQNVATPPKMYIASRGIEPIAPQPLPIPQKSHLALHTLDGIEMIPFREIIRAESDGNYCIIYCNQGQRLVASRTLGCLEDILPKQEFTRIHKSHLVRITEIRTLRKNEVVLINGDQLPLSRHQRNEVIDQLQAFSARM